MKNVFQKVEAFNFRRVLRSLTATLLAVVLLAAVTPSASATGNVWSHSQRWNRAHQIHFGSTPQFMQYWNSDHSTGIDTTLIWSSDGCGGMPPILNAAFNPWMPFADQCRQHDFGYRNFGNLYAPAWYKSNIDSHFYWRMVDRCGVWWIRYSGNESQCNAGAMTFYGAVYHVGKLGKAGKCGFEWQSNNCLGE